MRPILNASWSMMFSALLAAASAAHAGAANSRCALCNIAVSAGMDRLDLEKQVALALGRDNSYSPYANNLDGGRVDYKQGRWTLRVLYSRGTPAPRVINAQGTGEHLPPMDSKVLSHELIRSGNPGRRVTRP